MLFRRSKSVPVHTDTPRLTFPFINSYISINFFHKRQQLNNLRPNANRYGRTHTSSFAPLDHSWDRGQFRDPSMPLGQFISFILLRYISRQPFVPLAVWLMGERRAVGVCAREALDRLLGTFHWLCVIVGHQIFIELIRNTVLVTMSGHQKRPDVSQRRTRYPLIYIYLTWT